MIRWGLWRVAATCTPPLSRPSPAALRADALAAARRVHVSPRRLRLFSFARPSPSLVLPLRLRPRLASARPTPPASRAGCFCGAGLGVRLSSLRLYSSRAFHSPAFGGGHLSMFRFLCGKMGELWNKGEKRGMTGRKERQGEGENRKNETLKGGVGGNPWPSLNKPWVRRRRPTRAQRGKKCPVAPDSAPYTPYRSGLNPSQESPFPFARPPLYVFDRYAWRQRLRTNDA